MRLPSLRSACPTLTAAALVMLAHGDAMAEPLPAEVDARYGAILGALEQGESRARLWWYGWTLGFAALTVGETATAVVTHDGGLRADAVVGASGSALGLGAMLLLTSRSAFQFRDRLAAIDTSTPDGRLARLREAERILDEAADDETGGHSIFAHLGSDVVTLAGSFVLWAGYHRYASGWLNLVGGVVVGEAQILTRPTAAIFARRAYRAGLASAEPPSPRWFVIPAPGGMSAGCVF